MTPQQKQAEERALAYAKYKYEGGSEYPEPDTEDVVEDFMEGWKLCYEVNKVEELKSKLEQKDSLLKEAEDKITGLISFFEHTKTQGYKISELNELFKDELEEAKQTLSKLKER